MNAEKVGKFISELRKEKDLKQSDLAKMLNVTDKAVSRWETGKGLPDISLLIPLSEVLGISVNELLSGERVKEDKVTEEKLKTTINMSLDSMRKREKVIKYSVLVFACITLILLYLSESLSTIGVLEILVISLVLLMSKFLKTKSKKLFIPIVLILLYTFYSFFTYTGSVRLEVFLMRHPFKAYTAKIEEKTDRKNNNERYFYVHSDIQVTSGSMGLIKCEDYFGFKISSYYGF